MAVTIFYLLYIILVCAVLMKHSSILYATKNWNGQSKVKDLTTTIPFQRNDGILTKGYRNIRKSEGEMSRISLNISGKIREFAPEILVGNL